MKNRIYCINEDGIELDYEETKRYLSAIDGIPLTYGLLCPVQLEYKYIGYSTSIYQRWIRHKTLGSASKKANNNLHVYKQILKDINEHLVLVILTYGNFEYEIMACFLQANAFLFNVVHPKKRTLRCLQKKIKEKNV